MKGPRINYEKLDSNKMSYTVKKREICFCCNGSKFQVSTLKIFNVVNENGVISNGIINLTFTYIKFHANLHKI